MDVSETTETPDDKYPLRSVGRALDVLQALGAASGNGMSVGEIAEAIGVSRSTAFTLLQTMVTRGFVADTRIGGARLYRLGLTLVHLGDRAVAEMGITQIATPILQQLTDATQLTSRLAVLDDGYAVAILTRLGMPRRTEHTLTSQAALIEDLRETAARGYAFDNEEDNIGVVCVGAAVYDRTGEAVAAISVTSMKLGRSLDDLHQLGSAVRAYADRISLLLGGPAHSALPPLP